MRIYKTLYECVSETERNLFEMGIEVPIKTMQNLNVEGDPDLGMTKELMGVTFQILNPFEDYEKAYDLIFKNSNKKEKNLLWVDEEFEERINSKGDVNPGEAWKIRQSEWEPFLVYNTNNENCFHYTYNERYFASNQLPRLIEYLKKDKNSRRAVLSMWLQHFDLKGLENRFRVPCSVTYSWLFRNDKMNIFYHMRSSDLYTHFVNDMMLAAKLNQYVSHKIGVEPGILTVYINSLHAYAKQLKERKIF